MQDARLHRDGGPAFASRDGWKLWYLNGVQVSQEIAEIPAGELDSRLVLSEQNVEVRREIVRKIGAERVLSELDAEAIDTSGDYSLLLLDLQDGRKRPYLKMLNPSIGTWHVEGVHPDCATVEQAIAWRNGAEAGELPMTLT